jgi:pyruvate/2-oxoacid:ferredoxin oxidoreductase beta subunit
MARQAVTSKVYPILEITENGTKLSVWKDFEPTPFRDYLKPQGRFRHLNDEEIAQIEAEVEANWRRLLAKEAMLASIAGLDA